MTHHQDDNRTGRSTLSTEIGMLILIFALIIFAAAFSACRGDVDAAADDEHAGRTTSSQHGITSIRTYDEHVTLDTNDNESSLDDSDSAGDAERPPRKHLPSTNPDGIPIAESMPYIGLPEELIDRTWLGEHDIVDEVIGGSGLLAGSVPYQWCAENGTDDIIFTAYVRDGEVIKVNKNMLWSNYWSVPDSFTSLDYPDLDASGERVEVEPLMGNREDPLDYDTPEEYADNAEDWFRANGSEDPWDEAYRYWEDNGP